MTKFTKFSVGYARALSAKAQKSNANHYIKKEPSMFFSTDVYNFRMMFQWIPQPKEH